jgi:hypothetical protein
VKDIRALSLSTKSESVKLKAYDMLMKHLGGYANELNIISKMGDAELDALVNKILQKV